MLTVKKELVQHDSGDYIRYTPTLTTGTCFTGSLTFAVWEVDLHAPEAQHKEAIENAKKNARQVLASLATAV